MKMYLISLAFLAGSLVPAQTVSIPAASTPTPPTLSWTLPSACTATAACTFQPYRIAGICPATIVGSGGWTILSISGANATSITDSSATGQISYVVEVLQNGLNSAPSNCVTTTVPNVPSPVTVTAVP